MIRFLKRWLAGSKQPDGEDLLSKVRRGPIPRHVAIIMDGNGRWAKKRGLPRVAGHREGMNTVREITRAADELGIEILTLYSFSTENWKRPREEVDYLMRLPQEFLHTDLDELVRRNVQVRMIGDETHLPDHTRSAIRQFQEATRNNTGLILNFALNYGSRDEILRAVRRIIEDVQSGKMDKDAVDEAVMNRYLYTAGLPDPDLVIRTSGEIRISNFMLWQLAYSELWFTNVSWPEFRRDHFFRAIEDYQHRSRRFGAV
ncbi:MAG: isoprenyl transferase [Planifilum fulgidum]